MGRQAAGDLHLLGLPVAKTVVTKKDRAALAVAQTLFYTVLPIAAGGEVPGIKPGDKRGLP